MGEGRTLPPSPSPRGDTKPALPGASCPQTLWIPTLKCLSPPNLLCFATGLEQCPQTLCGTPRPTGPAQPHLQRYLPEISIGRTPFQPPRERGSLCDGLGAGGGSGGLPPFPILCEPPGSFPPPCGLGRPLSPATLWGGVVPAPALLKTECNFGSKGSLTSPFATT